MHHALAVDVLQRPADAERDLHSALRRKLPLIKNLPQQPPFNPLHNHVNLAMAVLAHYLHHARMIQLLADLLLAMETIEEDGIGLHLRMRDLYGYLVSVIQIDGPKDRCHAAAG